MLLLWQLLYTLKAFRKLQLLLYRVSSATSFGEVSIFENNAHILLEYTLAFCDPGVQKIGILW